VRDSPFADGVAESIAQRLDAVGRYLTVSDTDRLLADVESPARRVPLTFTVTGFLLGFSTGRFLRASRDLIGIYNGRRLQKGSFMRNLAHQMVGAASERAAAVESISRLQRAGLTKAMRAWYT
jgi:hypothetical protein